MDKPDKNNIRNIWLKAIAISLLFLSSLGLFSLLTHEVVFENEDWFDTKAFNFFNSFTTPAVISFFKVLTFFGAPYFLIPSYLVLIIFLFIKKRRADALDIAIIAVTSTALSFALKAIIGRDRPALPLFKSLTKSFPSGHALSSFIFCSVLIWLLWKSKMQIKWKWILSCLLIAFSLSIGISRIVLRYHYASDVLAGFCMGLAWVLFSFWVLAKMRK
jgi:undecaprenyl-diphosphatase